MASEFKVVTRKDRCKEQGTERKEGEDRGIKVTGDRVNFKVGFRNDCARIVTEYQLGNDHYSLVLPHRARAITVKRWKSTA